MKFVIIGAGGIGSYYGAKLQQAGHQVVLVARGDHLDAMQTNGLQIKHPNFEFNEVVTACSQQELSKSHPLDSVDLVIIAVKATHTEGLMNDLGDWLASANTPVLSLQNGVDNELTIEKHIGKQRTVGGLAIRIGGHIVAPGVIEATGPAEVVIGAWSRGDENVALQDALKPVATFFNEAGIPTRLSEQIQHELWTKLLINNGVNPLSALTKLDTRTLTSHPVYGSTVYGLMQEVALAAKADDVELTQEEVDEMYQLICQFDAIKTSMLVDREKGRPLETDAISGAVIERCNRLGQAAPISALIDALLTDQIG